MRKLVFHHLSKTAGSSLITALNARVEGRTCPARYDFELDEQAIDDPQYIFYHGHYSHAMARTFRERLPGDRCFLFTFLRNPLDRILSQYFNWTDREKIRRDFAADIQRAGRTPQLVEAMAAFEDHIFKMSLADFLASDLPKVRAAIDNHYVRFLGDSGYAAGNANRLLQSAMENLDGFYDFYGLKEYYGHSVQALYDIVGFGTFGDMPAEQIRKNLNAAKPASDHYEVNRTEMEQMMSHCYLDLQLYQYALGRYVQRYALRSSSFDLAHATGPVTNG